MQGNRRLISFTAATILVTGILATGAALAAVVSSSSTALLRIDNRSNNVAHTTTSTSFGDLPGTVVPVSVPAGGRLIRACFTAKSTCEGTIGVSCVVRIVAFNPASSAILELNPQAGSGFAFGTVSGDTVNAHAMERSRRLTPGNYHVKVQVALNGAMSAFHLDDWHFTVETFQ